MPRPRTPAHIRHRQARILLLVGFVILRGADWLLFWFLQQPPQGYMPMLGVVIGSIVASTALIIATWQRQPWSRYVLLAVLWGVVAAFCVPLLGLTVSKDELSRAIVGSLFGGVGLYLFVILIFTVSKPIQRLTKTDAS